ncbi:MAG: hypothetical protein ACNYPH_00140 [Gammaproteobacteria bacterium WSBS_2016_MAG_OTU1]
MEKRGFLEKFNAVGGYILLIGMFIMPIVMAANSRSLDYTERWGVFVMPIVMAANSDNISLYFILQMITLGMIVLGCFIIFIDFRKLKLNSLIKLFGYSVVVCSALLLVFGVMCALFLRQQYNIDFLDSFLSTIVSHIGQPILSAIAPHLKQPIEYYILFHDFTIKSLLGIVFVGLFIVLAKLWPVCMIAIGVIIFTCFFVLLPILDLMDIHLNLYLGLIRGYFQVQLERDCGEFCKEFFIPFAWPFGCRFILLLILLL